MNISSTDIDRDALFNYSIQAENIGTTIELSDPQFRLNIEKYLFNRLFSEIEVILKSEYDLNDDWIYKFNIPSVTQGEYILFQNKMWLSGFCIALEYYGGAWFLGLLARVEGKAKLPFGHATLGTQEHAALVRLAKDRWPECISNWAWPAYEKIKDLDKTSGTLLKLTHEPFRKKLADELAEKLNSYAKFFENSSELRLQNL